MRVAIVGTGYIARVHARIVRDLGGKVVAVCGRSLASASAFGFGQAYDNLASLLAKQGPDVVHLCTPNHLHAEQAITAFAAGAHVLAEKPMAHSPMMSTIPKRMYGTSRPEASVRPSH